MSNHTQAVNILNSKHVLVNLGKNIQWIVVS